MLCCLVHKCYLHNLPPVAIVYKALLTREIMWSKQLSRSNKEPKQRVLQNVLFFFATLLYQADNMLALENLYTQLTFCVMQRYTRTTDKLRFNAMCSSLATIRVESKTDGITEGRPRMIISKGSINKDWLTWVWYKLHRITYDMGTPTHEDGTVSIFLRLESNPYDSGFINQMWPPGTPCKCSWTWPRKLHKE